MTNFAGMSAAHEVMLLMMPAAFMTLWLRDVLRGLLVRTGLIDRL